MEEVPQEMALAKEKDKSRRCNKKDTREEIKSEVPEKKIKNEESEYMEDEPRTLLYSGDIDLETGQEESDTAEFSEIPAKKIKVEGPVEAVENAEYFANNISKFMQVQEQKVLEIARKHVTHMKERFDQEKGILNEKISDLEIENNKLSGNVGFLEDYIEVLKAENKKLKVETENHSQFKINSISYMEEALTESQENAVKLEKNAEKEVIDEPLQLKINCISFSPIVHSRNENFRHPEFNQNLSRNRNELTETYMNASSTLAFRGDQVQKIKNCYQENEYEPCAPESSKNRRNKLRKYQQWTPRISFWDHRVLLLGMFFCLIVSFFGLYQAT